MANLHSLRIEEDEIYSSGSSGNFEEWFTVKLRGCLPLPTSPDFSGILGIDGFQSFLGLQVTLNQSAFLSIDLEYMD